MQIMLQFLLNILNNRTFYLLKPVAVIIVINTSHNTENKKHIFFFKKWLFQVAKALNRVTSHLWLSWFYHDLGAWQLDVFTLVAASRDMWSPFATFSTGFRHGGSQISLNNSVIHLTMVKGWRHGHGHVMDDFTG